MNFLLLVLAVLALSSFAYAAGTRRSMRAVGGKLQTLHSLPGYYGLYVALWCGLPALLLMVGWVILEPSVVHSLVLASLPPSALLDAAGTPLPPDRVRLLMTDIANIASGNISSSTDPLIAQAGAYQANLQSTGRAIMIALTLALAVAGSAWGLKAIAPRMRARNTVEKVVKIFMIACSTVAILTTIGIVLSLVFESFRFFQQVSPVDFLFGMKWSPQVAMRADQVGSSGAFGAVPLFVGTALISAIAMVVAVPIGLMSAIYMSEYAAPGFRAWAKPALEVLAGIPTVVYGFFAALTVAPAIRRWGESIGLDVSSESALAAGLVMGIMIIPFVSSLSDDVITAVPQSMREGSYGLGATKSETIRRVIFPAALPGIVGGILLAVSRAIGETMIVVMAAGLAANLTANPFEAVTTVTVQIVTLLVGDQEFDSPKTLAAFALGLVLFFVTLILNIIALHVVRKYREQYD
ncbi:phosphate ABC transporter permease subunit PstC [Rhodospirillum rubrum]|uniref:phosphate ABC transporter permease subunit PstC n=1 Tax=Rhodospirillum rubrum TaxID=1085 RepID=UPI0019043EE6|nr:phosphate ABC transporter permease subunit PstC [Rhodospirillum rubrum]MBK1664421.1 phosphate ABC transporter permease subunit PstC [Rhodospirillum rubrum]MBK1675295.1 phosphate ABC transporter permease subunit PstC [Rhodospirillum rubrum]